MNLQTHRLFQDLTFSEKESSIVSSAKVGFCLDFLSVKQTDLWAPHCTTNCPVFSSGGRHKDAQ